jgi:gamma-glutamyl-gamma-aminobutyrate hydrolase PuuD
VAADVLLASVAGLVITGGPDVDPATYGADAHSETDTPRPERDAFETALCLGALQRGIPLLAICRGLQVLNVSLGGTLYQHLPEVLGHDEHRAEIGQMSPNMVTLNPESAIGALLGSQTEGLCHHHQAIDRLGKGLVAVGFAADGTVEAVEVESREFALGVQWHPEDNPADDRLFVALVGAASRYRDAGAGGPSRLEAVTPTV